MATKKGSMKLDQKHLSSRNEPRKWEYTSMILNHGWAQGLYLSEINILKTYPPQGTVACFLGVWLRLEDIAGT